MNKEDSALIRRLDPLLSWLRPPNPFELHDINRSQMAWLAVVGGACGLLSTVPELSVALSVPLLAIFLTVAPGSLIVAMLPHVPRPLVLGAVPALGWSILGLISAVELGFGAFRPEVTTIATSLFLILVGSILVARLNCTVWPGRWNLQKPDIHVTIALTLSVVAIATAGTAFVRIPSTEPTQFGPLVRAPELLLAATLAACSITIALARRSRFAAWVSVAAAVVIARGVPYFSTEQGLYSWSYRHLGVMDWFLRDGHYVRDVDVYNNWPVSLSLGAWFLGSSGMDPLDLNHGFQFYYHFLLVVAVYSLGRCFGLDCYGALGGAFVVEIASWVGQDYLSPQAFGYLLASTVIAALLVTQVKKYRLAGSVIALLVILAVVWAHQLTPVWILIVAFGLMITRAFQPWWLLVLIVIIYLSSVIPNMNSIIENSSDFSFNVFENTSGNVKTLGSAGQQLQSNVVKSLSLALWVVSAIIAIRSVLRGGSPGALLIVGFGSFALLITSYGGETIFRVYLFSLLGCGILVGGALQAGGRGHNSAIYGRKKERDGGVHRDTAVFTVRSQWLRISTIALITSCIFGLGLQGFLGGFYVLNYTSDDVEVARRIEANAGPNGVVQPLVWAYPFRSTRLYLLHKQNDPLPHARWNLLDGYAGTNGRDPVPVAEFTEAVRYQASDRPVYVVLAHPMKEYADYFGSLKDGAELRILNHFKRAGWKVVEDSHGVVVVANDVGVQQWRE